MFVLSSTGIRRRQSSPSINAYAMANAGWRRGGQLACAPRGHGLIATSREGTLDRVSSGCLPERTAAEAARVPGVRGEDELIG